VNQDTIPVPLGTDMNQHHIARYANADVTASKIDEVRYDLMPEQAEHKIAHNQDRRPVNNCTKRK
jgi:hypothetical protein